MSSKFTYVVHIGKETFEFSAEQYNTATQFAEIAKNYTVTNSEVIIELKSKVVK